MGKKIDKASLVPMPWRDFVLGFQVATHALDNPNLEGIPKPANADDPLGRKIHATQMAIQRDPFLRVLSAVQEYFGQGYEYLGCFNHRFWALMQLVRRGHLEAWLTTSEEAPEVQQFHPAVLLAAAELKLTKNGRFPVNQFLHRVEEILHEEGGAESTPEPGL